MRTLTNQQALDFLKHYKVPVLDYTPVEHAEKLAKCKTPFVLKVDSSHIPHKKERNLVRFVHNLFDAQKHWHAIRKHGHVIKQRFHDGHPVVIQVVRSSGAKPSIVVGLSGISVDFHKDFVERQCPLSENDAREMLKELNVFSHIDNFNGSKTKLNYLEQTLMRLSEIAAKEPDLVALEVDPFMLSHCSGRVVDAKVILES